MCDNGEYQADLPDKFILRGQIRAGNGRQAKWRTAINSCGLAFVIVLAVNTVAMAQSGRQSERWYTSRATGQVFRNGTSLDQGQYLELGDKINTGQRGRALLLQRRNRVIVLPGSRFQIPETAGRKYRTEIFQFLGQIQYDVTYAPWRRFAVRTPYLAVVVKGTAFTIDIGPAETTVSVTRGSVQVIDGDTGERTMLAPGQAVTSAHRPNAGLERTTMRTDRADGQIDLDLATTGQSGTGAVGADVSVGISEPSAGVSVGGSLGSRTGGRGGLGVGGGIGGGLDF